MTKPYDIVVIGGGINGAGIARDAAGRGLRVLLCEQNDLAEGTSSRSGKLVHGGLRYLEYYEFRLVREALIEREVLLNSAPHIIWPMRFVLPLSKRDRPSWLVRTGLFLYDHLGGRKKLPGTRSLKLSQAPEGAPLKDNFNKAFEYSDCWVDDARLVVLNALDASQNGAVVKTRTKVVDATRQDNLWSITLEGDKKTVVQAKVLVNAAGPWVNEVLRNVVHVNSRRNVKLVKGSHLIVPKFWKGNQAYLIQNTDKRVIFVNPYEGDLALIGTTDIPYEGDPAKVEMDENEMDYLIACVNDYFKEQLTRADVIKSYSGVRPLFDDGNGNPSAVTRDYSFDLSEGGAPLLSVYGGKITTFRKLSEHALEKLAPFFPEMEGNWTAQAVLPGGNMPDADFEGYIQIFKNKYPWLPKDIREHYLRHYGTKSIDIIGGSKSIDDLGQHFGSTLYEVEANYLRQNEWAMTSEDILWRRTKYRLHLSDDEQTAFAKWFDGQTK